jgi:hypothetical protein
MRGRGKSFDIDPFLPIEKKAIYWGVALTLTLLAPLSALWANEAEPLPSAEETSIFDEAILTPKLEAVDKLTLSNPEELVSRLQLAKLLVSWFSIPTRSVSDFPVFIDVPLEHADYAIVDTVRRYHLMFGDDSGNFLLQAPSTRLDLWLAMAKVVQPKNTLRETEAVQLVRSKPGGDSIPAYHSKRIARLFLDQILKDEQDLPLEPETVLTQGYIQHVVSNLKSSQVYLKAKEREQALSVLPESTLEAGIVLTLTPSQVLSTKQLTVGHPVYFLTQAPISLASGKSIPVGSSVEGVVSEANVESRTFTLNFSSLRSADDGQKFRFQGNLSLTFPKDVWGESIIPSGTPFRLLSQ